MTSMSRSTLPPRSETGQVTRFATTIDLEERVALRPTRDIRRTRAAKMPWPTTDGIKHPVTRRFKAPATEIINGIASPTR